MILVVNFGGAFKRMTLTEIVNFVDAPNRSKTQLFANGIGT
jgi:hypothetical protein